MPTAYLSTTSSPSHIHMRIGIMAQSKWRVRATAHDYLLYFYRSSRWRVNWIELSVLSATESDCISIVYKKWIFPIDSKRWMHFHACNAMRQNMPCTASVALCAGRNEKTNLTHNSPRYMGKSSERKQKRSCIAKNTFEALSACDRMCYTFNGNES